MRERMIWVRACMSTVALVVLVVLVWASAASAATAPTVNAASSDALGARIIVDGAGRTLYRFTLDSRKSIRCSGACARTWPPVIVRRAAKLVAGNGLVQARLGTLKRPDGRLQLTWAGFPVYRFALDRRAGDVKGHGLGGTWFAVAASGRLVKALPAADSGGATTPSPTTPDPTAPPYGY